MIEGAYDFKYSMTAYSAIFLQRRIIFDWNVHMLGLTSFGLQDYDIQYVWSNGLPNIWSGCWFLGIYLGLKKHHLKATTLYESADKMISCLKEKTVISLLGSLVHILSRSHSVR